MSIRNATQLAKQTFADINRKAPAVRLTTVLIDLRADYRRLFPLLAAGLVGKDDLGRVILGGLPLP